MSIIDSISHLEIVQKSIKPWVERNTEPLKKTDFLWLITGLALAALVVSAAVYRLGRIALPLGLCAGALVAGLWGLYCQSKIQRYYSQKASEQIGLMKSTADTITVGQQNFSDIEKIRTELDKPEYQHLQDDFKKLDNKTREFRDNLAYPGYEDKLTSVQKKLEALKVIVQANDADKALVEGLEAQIAKVGTPKQDFAAIETEKQKLKNLQTAGALQLFETKIEPDLKALTTMAKAPNFADSKNTYLTYLDGLQKKFS